MAKHTQEFIEALTDFMAYVREMEEAEYMEKYSNLPVPPVSNTNGSKFTKIFVDGRIYAFVDKATGLIYKPASRIAPAEHPRGSVYNFMTWTCAGPYGIAYIRGKSANIGCYVNGKVMNDLVCDKCKARMITHPNPCEGMTKYS